MPEKYIKMCFLYMFNRLQCSGMFSCERKVGGGGG